VSTEAPEAKRRAAVGGGAPAPGADALEICPPGAWRSQFAHPRGLLGRLAGALMARKNAAMNDAAVARLQLRPGDSVLEVGFGHGRTLAALAARVPRGRVAGVDPSEVMLAMAARRNRAAAAAGRVDLRLGSAEQLPFADASFDAAYAANSVQFWPGPERSLRELRRVLRPAGTLLLAIRLHEPGAGRFASPGFRPAQVDDVARRLAACGFAVRREDVRAGRALALLFARTPAA
jgi:SAM-dependent methyltransferase